MLVVRRTVSEPGVHDDCAFDHSSLIADIEFGALVYDRNCASPIHKLKTCSQHVEG